ncbi:hypothetical protein LPJ66_003830, partial [Kickxella alabastrina]
MASRTKHPTNARPGTSPYLGLGSTNTNKFPPILPTRTARSISNTSSPSVKGAAPCFHTTRPQFISSHIERCEACRLKYARQAEVTTRPYSPLGMRRTSGALMRSGSRQSLGGSNRPSSAASTVSPPSPVVLAADALPGASLRPSSRASVASTKGSESGRPASALRPKHSRSSSAGSPLVDGKSNTQRAVAQASELDIPSNPSGAVSAVPPARGDNAMPAIPAMPTMYPDDDLPLSPTGALAIRSRTRSVRTSGKLNSHPREGLNSNGGAAARESRRGSSHTSHIHRHAGNESPTLSIRTASRKGGMMAAHPDHIDENEQVVIIDEHVLLDAVTSTMRVDEANMMGQRDTEMNRLKGQNRLLRRLGSQPDPEQGDSPKQAGFENIFGVTSPKIRQKALERMIEMDKAALDKFDEFNRAYDECAPSLRTNRVQFAGERPLSPPPAARQWAGGVSTPIRLQADGGDHEPRLPNFSSADARRLGEELMSTPGRRKPQRTMRTNSMRRPARSRINKPIFSGGSDESDDTPDSEDFDDDDDDHRDLRMCLMTASKFGTFLVQYITRQCLDYNTLCEENKAIMKRFEDLEKLTVGLDRSNRKAEEARDEQAAKLYEMSTENQTLKETISAEERNTRRLVYENEKLKKDLVASNERIMKLDAETERLNVDMAKARQRYDQDISDLRRNTKKLAEDKTMLADKNNDLRTELMGKLKRVGLKADVDEYLAGRSQENADAAAAAASGPANELTSEFGPASGQINAAKATDDNKKLKEAMQFFHRKLDKAKRKLYSEKVARAETERILRIQQEETHRYQQMYGVLPDDASVEGMETMGDFMPTSVGGDNNSLRIRTRARTMSIVTADLGNAANDSDINSDDGLFVMSGDAMSPVGNTADLMTGPDMLASPEQHRLSRVGSQSSISSNGEDADELAIRRFEQRKQQQQRAAAAQVAPRGRRAGGAKAPPPISTRRTKNSLLSLDINNAGESLGDILGASGQWGDPLSSRGKSSMRGPLSARSIEASGSFTADLSGRFDDNASIRSIDSGTTTKHQRTRSTRSIRAMPSPFGDALAGIHGFGISYDASVSLAEQLALVTPKMKSRTATVVFDRPAMVDASTSTDALPECVGVGVQASLSLPSADAVVATASAEPNATVSMGVQAVASLADGQCSTDRTIGTQSNGVYASPMLSSAGVGTDISSFVVGHRSVDNVPLVSSSGVQVAADTASAHTETDSRVGVTDASTSLDITYRNQGCYAQAELASQGVVTDRMLGMRHQGISATAATSSVGVSAGAGSVRDSTVATVGPALVERGSATVGPSTTDCSAVTLSLDTCDTQVCTDDSLLVSWLAPLIPAGVGMAAVLAALHGRGESIYEQFRAQVADTARSEAFAEHERLAALAAEQAAEKATAQVKIFSDKCVSSEISTGEQAVQVEPKQAFKYVQAGSLSVASVGIDACLGPALVDVGVGTETHPVSRWVEPFDPVAKETRGVAAIASVSERATLHEVVYASASVGPSCTFGHAAVDAKVDISDRATAMDVTWSDAAAGPMPEYGEQAIDASSGRAVSAGVSTAVEVTERAISNAPDSSSRYTETEVAVGRGVGTGPVVVDIFDKSEGPAQYTSHRSTGPFAGAVSRGVGTEPSAIDVSDKSEGPVQETAHRSTSPELDVADGVSTAAAIAADAAAVALVSTLGDGAAVFKVATSHAGVQAAPTRADASVATSTAPGISSDVAVGRIRSVAEVGTITETMVLEAESGPETEAASRTVLETETVPEAQAQAEAAFGPAVAATPPATRPPIPAFLPPLAPGFSRRSVEKANSATDINLQFSRKLNIGDVPMHAGPKIAERESDGEDYGYIMVSPRTNVQYSATPDLLTSQRSKFGTSSSSIRSKFNPLARFGRAAPSQDSASLAPSARELGCDQGDEEADVTDKNEQLAGASSGEEEDVEESEDEGFSALKAHTFGNSRAPSVFGAPPEAVKRHTMNIGVDAAESQMRSHIVRQPEPLIV